MSSQRRLKFGGPGTADIVIFDEVNHFYVRNAVNERLQTRVFNMHPNDVFINLTILVIFIRRFFSHNIISNSKHVRGFLVGFLVYARNAYIEACIISMRPRAVVTFIDNSGVFHWLSRNCRLFPFIAIQNGSRPAYQAGTGVSNYHAQHLFCYGKHETLLFSKLGHVVENYYPKGSLLASLYLKRPYDAMEKKYDILVVSTWRGNIGFTKEVQDTMRSMEIMDRLLAKYLSTNQLKAAVILRNEKDGPDWFMPEVGLNEMDYFKGIYGDRVELIETNFKERNIFPLMQQSEIIMSCLSSALYEAFGIGRKVLFCNFTGVNTYHSDIHDSILTTDSSYEGFVARMDSIVNTSINSYRQENMPMMKYYMNFPETKPSFVAISEKIDEIIGNG